MLKIIPNRELFCNFPFGMIFFCTFATVSQAGRVCQANVMPVWETDNLAVRNILIIKALQ